MAGPRKYRLLCPIARALDRVGDRWTLLILRDLCAGPARFSDIQAGLDGIASNLLTNRLQQLLADGLITRRKGEYGLSLYELTDIGGRIRDILFELALFGSRFPPDTEINRPGNLRTIAVTLEVACQRVVASETEIEAEIQVDEEVFTLIASDGTVSVRNRSADKPDVTLITNYEAMVAVADGRMALDTYSEKHVRLLTMKAGKGEQLMALLGSAIILIRGEAGT